MIFLDQYLFVYVDKLDLALENISIQALTATVNKKAILRFINTSGISFINIKLKVQIALIILQNLIILHNRLLLIAMMKQIIFLYNTNTFGKIMMSKTVQEAKAIVNE